MNFKSYQFLVDMSILHAYPVLEHSDDPVNDKLVFTVFDFKGKVS